MRSPTCWMLLCLEDTVLLERDRAFLGEDGSFSWLPMASGHRRVQAEGSELSCHSPGGGTHCGEGEPGQGPLCGSPRLGTPLPAALLPPTKGNGAVPGWGQSRTVPCTPTTRTSPLRGCPRPGRAVSPCLSFPTEVPPGAGSRARCRPALPRLTSPVRRVQSPVRIPRPARWVPLLAPPPHLLAQRCPGSPSDNGQRQPRPRPTAEGMRTVRGSPRRPAAATPTPLR